MAASTSSASPVSTRIIRQPPSRWTPRARAKPLTGEKRPFRAYGPTCDPPTCCRGRYLLPDGIANGDYIVFDAMGAYTVSSRSPFNGYYPDAWARDRLILPRGDALRGPTEANSG